MFSEASGQPNGPQVPDQAGCEGTGRRPERAPGEPLGAAASTPEMLRKKGVQTQEARYLPVLGLLLFTSLWPL